MEEYKFESLSDVINTIKIYKSHRKRNREGTVLVKYNDDLETLYKCLEPLKKLNNLIGMDEIKKNIIDQILFFSQELNTDEMMHTCLTGPPGVGKTTLGKILSEIYCTLGFLKTDNFKVVSKVDLIAGYLGQTAIKTQKVLKSALDGVLFIDEAYSLGSGGSSDADAYGKECIDTITKFLSENTSDFIMIIAGYRDELDSNFFGLNRGLRRRFPWTYDIKPYLVQDLKNIFIYQVNFNKWKLDENIKLNNYQLLTDMFQENKELFDQNGGDTLILFDKTKICHSRRVFGKNRNLKKIIDISDIKFGMELFKNIKKNKKNEVPYGMYV